MIDITEVKLGGSMKNRLRDAIFSKLLYPSIRVRTAPPVSVRVRVMVSFSFTEID